MVVVIPCFNEPGIRYTLLSLSECDDPGAKTGIVVVVNSTENCPENILIQNKKTIDELIVLAKQLTNKLQLFVIEVENLPQKHGGVGWARKIGMDWAITHFNSSDNNNGVIVSLDADTLVEKNYLKSIYDYFLNNPEQIAATIYFEHAFNPHDLRNDKSEKASVLYELYMRYYRDALLYTGFPCSIYTVGSCFAVKAGAYVAQGGMNRRKAGEDFYFLQKIAMLGEIGEINITTVYPSARSSDRVPFGTGTVIQKYCEGDNSIEFTYPFVAFELLKLFFSQIESYFYNSEKLSTEDLSNDSSFVNFSKETNLHGEIQELIANCGSVEVFKKRFFHLFNAFRVLKWLNYAEVNNFPKTPLIEECHKLLLYMGVYKENIPSDPRLMLNLFRSIDRNCTND